MDLGWRFERIGRVQKSLSFDEEAAGVRKRGNNESRRRRMVESREWQQSQSERQTDRQMAE